MEDLENLSKKIIAQCMGGMEEDEEPEGELYEILLNTREQGQMMEKLIKNQYEGV